MTSAPTVLRGLFLRGARFVKRYGGAECPLATGAADAVLQCAWMNEMQMCLADEHACGYVYGY